MSAANARSYLRSAGQGLPSASRTGGVRCRGQCPQRRLAGNVHARLLEIREAGRAGLEAEEAQHLAISQRLQGHHVRVWVGAGRLRVGAALGPEGAEGIRGGVRHWAQGSRRIARRGVAVRLCAQKSASAVASQGSVRRRCAPPAVLPRYIHGCVSWLCGCGHRPRSPLALAGVSLGAPAHWAAFEGPGRGRREIAQPGGQALRAREWPAGV
mmetsp:Transcript_57666/g.167027  ORF Transcript_57666/g.167027 Transcript_57666/m.167027 type:complete len:212 (+) Transcript_57666:155-790(+)